MGPPGEVPSVSQCLVLREMQRGASKGKGAFQGLLLAKQDTEPALPTEESFIVYLNDAYS